VWTLGRGMQPHDLLQLHCHDLAPLSANYFQDSGKPYIIDRDVVDGESSVVEGG
jgi:hypothetical protein